MSNAEIDTDSKFFDIIFGTRAMRRLKPDPVPPELIEKILRAGQAAPSGGNAQNWGFLVVTDPAVKRKVQPYYAKAWDDLAKPHYDSQLKSMGPGEDRDKFLRQIDAVQHLTENFHDVPVWIVPCLKVGPNGGDRGVGASIYPAVQNMLLTARALGLGATLTTRHMVYAEEVDAIFGLPDGMRSFAILPIGFPEGNFGPVRREPLTDFVHRDHWGQPYF